LMMTTKTLQGECSIKAGSAFLADAERLLEGLDYSIAALREFASSGRGRVSIACLSSAVYRLLPPVFVNSPVKWTI